MFVSIVTITAVCVALAISGWNPPDESLYVEDSDLLLLSYDQAGFDWPYEISMDEFAEWFLFFDDQKLIDHQYSENHQCDCYGNAVYSNAHLITDRRNLPVLHITPFLTIRFPKVDLHRLTYLINGIQPDSDFPSWTNAAVQPKPGSLIRVNPSDRKPWPTISLDGRLLLLSIILHIAVWTYKHYFIDKKIREQIDFSQVTEERLQTFGRDIKDTLTRCTLAIDRIDRLDLKPKPINCVNPYIRTIGPDDMYSKSSRDAFDAKWHKFGSIKHDTDEKSRLYEIPDWRFVTKEY